MAKKEFTDRELMQMTIDVMNKSVNEPRPDGKVPPKVGAVVLFPDGRIETAHRGQLREGDHAEFTLLERKLGNESLENCILFTTLEPCVKRNPPKVPCCRRTTNARIRKVFVGIEDKDPTVDGKGIKHLEENGVEVKMFDRDFQKIIEAENKEFLKQALKRKKKQVEDDIRTPLELPITTYDSSKFSNEALQKFIDETNLMYSIKEDAFLEYLTDFGAMEWNNELKKFIPTGFGILLFGKNPRSKYPQAVLKAHVTYANNKVEPKDFNEPLVLLPDLIEEWLYKVLPLAKDTSNFKRKDVADFPPSVLREAIVNALVHRDYEDASAKCELKIDDNKIIVNSPGKPLPAISMEELNSFEAPSLSRNPIITYVFSLMDYVEEKGFGMASFKSLNKEYGLPIPKYTFKKPFLTLTFPRNIEAVKDVIGRDSTNSLTDNELKHFEIFRSNKPVTKNDFVFYSGLPTRTAQRMLKKFVDLKLIKAKGSGRSTEYIINN